MSITVIIPLNEKLPKIEDLANSWLQLVVKKDKQRLLVSGRESTVECLLLELHHYSMRHGSPVEFLGEKSCIKRVKV